MRWITLLALLVGCAAQTKRVWVRTDGTEGDFKLDKWECTRDSRTSWYASGRGIGGAIARGRAQAEAEEQAQQLYDLCMEGHGWSLQTRALPGAPCDKWRCSSGHECADGRCVPVATE